MNVTKVEGHDHEPMWEDVCYLATDFRPHLDGDIVNLWTMIMPESTVQKTESLLEHCTSEIARWVLEHKSKFSPGDTFQIIVGWPTSVRETGRQVIKTGGNMEALKLITDGITPIVPRRGWTNQVLNKKTQNKKAEPDSSA